MAHQFLSRLEGIFQQPLITASVLAAFFMMFRRIVNRYCGRIASLPAKVKVWQTFPARGWILIVFMMGLGIALRHIPAIPSAFIASFYSSLGPMLLLSSIRYMIAMLSPLESD